MADICPFDTTPLARPKPVARATFKNFNYTNQDYSSLKSRLVDLMKQSFGREFNNYMESDIAVMLTEIWAFIADTLSFKIDQIANEIFIDTVRELDNAMRLARFVGFKPTPPIPARAMFIASINNPIHTDIVIPTPVRVGIPSGNGSMELYVADQHNNPILDQPIIISAGTTSCRSIIGVEGFTHKAEMRSSGEANQVFDLKSIGVLWRSVQVYVDDLPWQEVEFFTSSRPSPEYRLEYTTNYRAYIIFGDNATGAVPPKGSRITVIYRVGGGSSGNVVTGSIKAKTNFPIEGFSHVVSVTYTNYTKGEYGYSGDTIEDIRRKMPAYMRSQHRAVAGSDYKSIAEQFATPHNGMIGKATVSLRNHGCAGNVIDLYVLARDGNQLALANASLKSELQEELERVKMFTDRVCVRDGKVSYVDIQIDCVCSKASRRQEEQLKETVTQRAAWFFRIGNWDFGQSLRDTDIIRAIADVKEIEHIEINFTPSGSQSVITASFNEIIRPDSIDIRFNYKD